MTQRPCGYSKLAVGLVALLAILLAVTPMSAHANVVNGKEDCVSPSASVDTDGDGFSNAEECNGITVQATGASLPNCATSGLSRDQCVDPNTQDVAIFLFPAASGSLIPANTANSPYHPFDIVTVVSGVTKHDGLVALGVIPHVFRNPSGVGGVAVSQSNRAVTTTQNGLVVFEDLSTSAIAMGKSKWGGPNLASIVDTRIYTQKIFCFVQQQYTGSTLCNLADKSHTDVSNLYILRTFNHEVSHALALTNHYDATLQNHYPTSSAYLMNQSVTVTKKGTTITWSIPTTYTLTEPQQDCYNISLLDASNNGVCQVVKSPTIF